jgi:hypothetical protein
MHPTPRAAATTPRRPIRPALLEIIASAEADPDSDEAYFLAQLRAVVAAVETPADRLLARYRGWPTGPAQLYAAYRD